MKGAVASGHPLTSAAACEMLARGGNAFDAVVSAAFAATVTEPCLTSLGGGGFLLAHVEESGEDLLYDFFVDSPGKGLPGPVQPELLPVDVLFRSTCQEFHAGAGSVAVPGMLKGLLHVSRALGTLDMETLVSPALRYLEDGVEVSDLQQYLLDMLRPILTLTDYGREIFGKGIRRLRNPLLRDFLAGGHKGAWLDSIYGTGAGRFEEQMRRTDGLVTAKDLREYVVVERRPLCCLYRSHEVLTNPPPSVGGGLLCFALSLLEKQAGRGRDETSRLRALADVMEKMNRMKNGAGGTTHISVVDSAGNAASMTSSNGSNSGVFLGETGIMLNNMMGEDDLHPGGFHAMEPGTRVGSMMSPTIVKRDGLVFSVLGSGGSKRIKTAMLQTIHNLIDRGMSPGEAVEAPRIHLDDDGVLHVEPGFDRAAVRGLEEAYKLNLWQEKDLYFGGVHTVGEGLSGRGDPRRDGHFLRCR